MQQFSDFEKPARVISVAELNRLAKELIEQNLPLMWVAGEISNFTRAASGHCYFSLKDAQAQVRCVMFRHRMQLQDWKPENGMQVEVRACPSFYEQRGEFQLNVEAMRRSGLGALYEAFEKLKARLQAEGLFDAAAKQPLPRFPRAIGVVTSLQAAALRDVLTTLRRRMAAIPVIVYPTPVQGAGAGAQIAAAIGGADARAECDVLIVCRGGGSIEDLWAFNEEVVARAIHACRLPVVSGVGHETDFTIADFVADARAPTPTAAAQMASPDRDDLRQDLSHLYQRLTRVTERALERRMQRLDVLARRLTHPGERIANQFAQLGHLASRLRSAWQMTSGNSEWRLRELYLQLLARRPDFAALATRQQTLAQRLASAAAHRVD
ncbi:MAG: exodeoxyribonuclease VII large subunit, partial [Burkholderiales bacterium]|nr:exodeoxyribonuclease VII large subunit [Burkholderiales bacterium]